MPDRTIIVVGAGFAGSIMARFYAESGKQVYLMEKRKHIAGNMYDYKDQFGIRIQKYGPHVFHTNSEKAYSFLTRFCDLKEYRLKCETVIEDVSTPSPFNFKTIDQFYEAEEAKKLKEKLIEYYKRESATVFEILNCEDKEIRRYARFLFEKDYKLYTAKQWGKKVEEIDPSILARVPVVFNYKDTYFYDKYEGVPAEGFTAVFQNILCHPNIHIELETDALKYIDINEEKQKVFFNGMDINIVFTGAIDELFEYKFGKLPYRSLFFEYEYFEQKDFQNVAIVAHPDKTDYTRITEYTKLPYQNMGTRTVIAKEYSVQYDKENLKGNEPYYPVLTKESIEIFEKYKEYAASFKNLITCGRLADFKYYNMDEVIDRTLGVCKLL